MELRLTILIVGRRVHIIKPKSMSPKIENAAMIRIQMYEYLSETGEFGGDTDGIEGGFDILIKGGGTNGEGGIKGVGGGDCGKGGYDGSGGGRRGNGGGGNSGGGL